MENPIIDTWLHSIQTDQSKGDLVTSKIGHWLLPPSVEGRGGSANANTCATSRLEQIRGILHPTVGARIIASARILHRSRPA